MCWGQYMHVVPWNAGANVCGLQ